MVVLGGIILVGFLVVDFWVFVFVLEFLVLVVTRWVLVDGDLVAVLYSVGFSYRVVLVEGSLRACFFGEGFYVACVGIEVA